MRKNDKDKEMDIIGSKREGITEMERKREMDDGGAEEMKMGRKRGRRRACEGEQR